MLFTNTYLNVIIIIYNSAKMDSAKMEPVSAHKDGMESTAHSKDALGGKKNDNFFNENMSNFVINFIQMFKSRTMSSWSRGII